MIELKTPEEFITGLQFGLFTGSEDFKKFLKDNNLEQTTVGELIERENNNPGYLAGFIDKAKGLSRGYNTSIQVIHILHHLAFLGVTFDSECYKKTYKNDINKDLANVFIQDNNMFNIRGLCGDYPFYLNDIYNFLSLSPAKFIKGGSLLKEVVDKMKDYIEKKREKMNITNDISLIELYNQEIEKLTIFFKQVIKYKREQLKVQLGGDPDAYVIADRLKNFYNTKINEELDNLGKFKYPNGLKINDEHLEKGFKN